MNEREVSSDVIVSDVKFQDSFIPATEINEDLI